MRHRAPSNDESLLPARQANHGLPSMFSSSRQRAAFGVVVAMLTVGCVSPDGRRLTRLSVGPNDTLIVNSVRPVRIPLRGIDARQRDVQVDNARFQLTAGDSITMSSDGVVTCTRSGDAAIRASFEHLVTTVVVRCRPVRSVRVAGPIQFIVGDSARAIPAQVLGLGGEPVSILAGTITLQDSGIVEAEGLRIRPLSVGGTLLSLRVGDQEGAAGVHVFELVTTLDSLTADREFVALRLRLESGESRRWRLPAGQWMLTMMPYEDEGRGLRLHVEGAVCMAARLTARRTVCEVKTSASVVVDNPTKTQQSGELLVRRVNS